MRLVLACMVALGVLVAAPAAQAADALLPDTRTLFLTERFTTGAVRAPLAAGPFPEQMLVLRGEREGFQFVVNNTSGGNLLLDARVNPDGALAGAQAAGQITWELLRVGHINVPQGSTGLGTSGGLYADPLPPFRSEKNAGLLTIPAGQFGGMVLLAKIRTDAPAGVYTGNVELFAQTGDIVYGRQAFSIDVRNANGGALMQNGDAGSMKSVFNVEGDAYWLQHKALRNGVNGGYPSAADRMLQLHGLMSFLDSRGVSALEYPFANPSASGDYACTYASANVAPFGFLAQLQQRYFSGANDVDPTRPPFPTRLAPNETSGCIPEDAKSGFHPTVDKYNTPSIKQDDVLHPRAASFYKKVASAWNANNLYGRSTYVKNPFDEPSDVTARMRHQMDVQVPNATKALRAAFGRKAKIVIADWPRDNRGKKVCAKRADGGKNCTNLSGDTTSNMKQWDGKGADDVDVWMAPYSRLFGRPSSPVLTKVYKVNRERQYADRLAKIKKLKGGREIWAYNFYTANTLSPQTTIDAPPTDSKMLFWVLAREGHTGMFISNIILGWGAETKLHPNGLRRKGNPYEQASYFKHSVYGYAANWGNYLYPGYAPDLGLDREADRNTADARPVSSLRMESMRDGQEDANVIAMYRKRFGAGNANARMKTIFPGKYVQLPKTLGQVMFPKYDNGNNLAQRLEVERRAMIVALSS